MIYSSYQVNVSTCLKSFHFLFTYPGKVFSAWTEVWSIPWPSTASIMAPAGSFLAKFDAIFLSLLLAPYARTCSDLMLELEMYPLKKSLKYV